MGFDLACLRTGFQVELIDHLRHWSNSLLCLAEVPHSIHSEDLRSHSHSMADSFGGVPDIVQRRVLHARQLCTEVLSM
jgi:hypothetical protein